MKTNANTKENHRDIPDGDLRQKIEERAYHIWLESGCGHGSHERHWMQAEGELMEAGNHEGRPQSEAHKGKKRENRR